MPVKASKSRWGGGEGVGERQLDAHRPRCGIITAVGMMNKQQAEWSASWQQTNHIGLRPGSDACAGASDLRLRRGQGSGGRSGRRAGGRGMKLSLVKNVLHERLGSFQLRSCSRRAEREDSHLAFSGDGGSLSAEMAAASQRQPPRRRVEKGRRGG
jgi:hypothetical protein